ncbi:MAG TPA: hypothetical protein PLK88_07385, partial [Methanothrix sp.]|nr:hypothetical protein [Methanothrix sp.]
AAARQARGRMRGEPRAPDGGGAAMAKLEPAVGQKSWLSNTSIFRNHRQASSSLARISADEIASLRRKADECGAAGSAIDGPALRECPS